MFMKRWKREFNWYLERGYGSDYMPEEVLGVLEEIPGFFSNIWLVVVDVAICTGRATLRGRRGRRRRGRGTGIALRRGMLRRSEFSTDFIEDTNTSTFGLISFEEVI